MVKFAKYCYIKQPPETGGCSRGHGDTGDIEGTVETRDTGETGPRVLRLDLTRLIQKWVRSEIGRDRRLLKSETFIELLY